jgi:hypothetical protein
MNPKTTFLIIPVSVRTQKMNPYKKEFFTLKAPELSTFTIFSSEAIKTTACGDSMEKLETVKKTMKGLKQNIHQSSRGYQIFHNYIREHEGLYGKTPAEA